MAPKPAFAQNAQIEHPKFGPGTVLACDDHYTVINFDDYGEKKFISSIVILNLKRLDRKPPEKKTRARRTRTKAAKKTAKAAS